MATPKKKHDTETKTDTKPEAAQPATETTSTDTTALASQRDQTTELAEYDFGEDEGKGFENQTNDDRKIPMIFVTQGLSKAVKDRKALPGQMINSVTGDVYDAIDIVPALTDHVWLQWVPRDLGGGFRGRHPVNSEIVTAAKKRARSNIGKLPVPSVDAKGVRLKDSKGKDLPDTEIVEAFEIAGVLTQAYRLVDGKLVPVFDADEPQMPVVISFTGSKIKHYRNWSSDVGLFQCKQPDGKGGLRKTVVPMFSHRVHIIVDEEHGGGNDYYVLKLSAVVDGDIGKSMIRTQKDPRYQAAKAVHAAYLSGAARAAYETTEQDDHATQGNAEAAASF